MHFFCDIQFRNLIFLEVENTAMYINLNLNLNIRKTNKRSKSK